MKELAKRAARMLCGDYGIYYVYRAPQALRPLASSSVELLDEPELATDGWIGAQASYAGDGSRAFGVREQGVLQAVCFYWFGARYRARGFWPLAEDEAKLVQIVTSPGARGRGLARKLIVGSTAMMRTEGWSNLYARVWHSNNPSWRAFEGAGWRRVALVVEINPLRLERPWRIRLPA